MSISPTYMSRPMNNQCNVFYLYYCTTSYVLFSRHKRHSHKSVTHNLQTVADTKHGNTTESHVIEFWGFNPQFFCFKMFNWTIQCLFVFCLKTVTPKLQNWPKCLYMGNKGFGTNKMYSLWSEILATLFSLVDW